MNQSNVMSTLLLVTSYVLGLVAAIVTVLVLYDMLIDVLQPDYMGNDIALSTRIGIELSASLTISMGDSLGFVVPSRILGVVSWSASRPLGS